LSSSAIRSVFSIRSSRSSRNPDRAEVSRFDVTVDDHGEEVSISVTHRRVNVRLVAVRIDLAAATDAVCEMAFGPPTTVIALDRSDLLLGLELADGRAVGERDVAIDVGPELGDVVLRRVRIARPAEVAPQFSLAHGGLPGEERRS
jgi:hypothetical protein